VKNKILGVLENASKWGRRGGVKETTNNVREMGEGVEGSQGG